MAQEAGDTWALGNDYEHYVGRWSRQVAIRFLDWLAQPPGLAWLDLGCGTGALTAAVLDRTAPRHASGIDPSAGFIAHARAAIVDARVEFDVGDARELPFADAAFDAAISGLAINFVPEPVRAVREMTRVVRTGGTVAAYVWDYAGKMDLMRYFWDAAVALDPKALDLDEGRRFPLCQPAPLSDLFAQAGLLDVVSTAIDVPTRFRDFDDYWTPFLGGQGPAPSYAMALPEPARMALRERIRAALPRHDDGRIELTARAWAVRGTVA